MENHNPTVSMDPDMNKYARRGVPPMNHVWPYPRHQYNQYSHCAHMYHEAVPQQSQQMQVQEMSHIQNQASHVQMPQVSQMQQSQASQIQQQSQVNQMQQQTQVSQILQQSQVSQMQQSSVNQMQQAQVSQMQQPQVAQMQQIQVQPTQISHAQVQSTDAGTALPSPAQQVTIVTNPLPNPAMGPLHDALTNRMNQNMKLNATVTVPSSQAGVSIQTPPVQIQSSKSHMEPQPTQILTRARMQDLVREVDPNEQLDDDVEEILLQMADDFVESSITAACLLAKHRKSSTVEVKDLQLHLERNWNMWIPGFGTDELRPYKRSSVNDAHKQRLTLIRKTLKKY